MVAATWEVERRVEARLALSSPPTTSASRGGGTDARSAWLGRGRGFQQEGMILLMSIGR